MHNQNVSNLEQGLERVSADTHIVVGDLVTQIPTVSSETICDDVNNFLCNNPDITVAAIVDDTQQVVGTLNASKFLATYSKQYSRELYGRKPIRKMANNAPLVFDEATDIVDLGADLPSGRSDDLLDGFAITRNGKYLGVGTGGALLRAQLRLLERRERELSETLKLAE